MDTKRDLDPLLSRESLQSRVPDYTAGQDPALALISPIFADLSGLPPLIIQAGSHEVLLDDAIRLARQAATADVAVSLDITPGVPHVFQAFYPILDEAAAALDRAGQLLTAHLASAKPRHRITKGQNALPRQPAGRGLKSPSATWKYQVNGLIAGNGHSALDHPVPAHTPGS